MDEFWSSIEEIASAEVDSVLQVGQVLDLFIDIVGEGWPFLRDDEPFVCARLILGAKCVEAHRKFARQRLVGCLQVARNRSEGWACFVAILLGMDDVSLDLITVEHLTDIFHLIYMFRFGDGRCITLYLKLLFVVLMRSSDKELLAKFDESFCEVVLAHVCEAETEQDVSLAGLLLLAALNHKYAVFSLPNQVMRAIHLTADTEHFHRFGECLVWHFNRNKTTAYQSLLCKLLYQVLATRETADLFYFNDLKVLVDILSRELLDMNRDREGVRELYLLVLLKLLNSTALQEQPYKQSDLVFTLRTSLDGTSDAAMVDLINECLSVPWLAWNCKVHASPHQSREDLALRGDVDLVSPFDDAMLSPGMSPTFSPGTSPQATSPIAIKVLSPGRRSGTASPLSMSPNQGMLWPNAPLPRVVSPQPVRRASPQPPRARGVPPPPMARSRETKPSPPPCRGASSAAKPAAKSCPKMSPKPAPPPPRR